MTLIAIDYEATIPEMSAGFEFVVRTWSASDLVA